MSKPDLADSIRAIMKRAVNDDSFRAKALQDASAALKEVGADIPAGQKIRFVEQLEEIVVVLPPKGLKDEEIDEKALASIAGGGSGCNMYQTWCVTTRA